MDKATRSVMTPLSSRARQALVWLGVVLSLVLAFAAVAAVFSRPARELADLPTDERRALYVRTLETLEGTCAHARGPELADYCQGQAVFVVRFPECDDACRDLAARFTSRPSR